MAEPLQGLNTGLKAMILPWLRGFTLLRRLQKLVGRSYSSSKLMGVLRGVTHEYPHPDTKPTAKNRDIDTVNSLAENLSFDPAQGTGDLVSLSAGLTGRQGCVL